MRFSRGRSTPARRAMRVVLLELHPKVWSASARSCPERVPAPAPAFGPGANPRGMRGQVCACWMVRPEPCLLASALPLLVAQVLADDHDPTVATDDLALVADRLHARLDLHGPAL